MRAARRRRYARNVSRSSAARQVALRSLGEYGSCQRFPPPGRISLFQNALNRFYAEPFDRRDSLVRREVDAGALAINAESDEQILRAVPHARHFQTIDRALDVTLDSYG